jgi:acyl-CoA reductase-like NAD-dependent aldehyde dehydrogenase
MAAYDNLLANVPTDLWIGGKWRKASDNARFDVIDPATEKKVASVASASVEDAMAALDAAQEAFEGWAARKPRERGEILRKAFELIMRDSERLAKLITIENGKARANDTIYGLVAYLYTKDLGRGLRVSEKLDFGMIGLNRGLVSDPAAPFGGMKQSGVGREGAHEGLMEFLETQYVSVSW